MRTVSLPSAPSSVVPNPPVTVLEEDSSSSSRFSAPARRTCTPGCGDVPAAAAVMGKVSGPPMPHDAAGRTSRRYAPARAPPGAPDGELLGDGLEGVPGASEPPQDTAKRRTIGASG